MSDQPRGSAATIEVNRDDLDAVLNLVERLRASITSRLWERLPFAEREAFDRIRRLTDGD